MAEHFKQGELEKLCSLDFHFQEVSNRFKKLGLWDTSFTNSHESQG